MTTEHWILAGAGVALLAVVGACLLRRRRKPGKDDIYPMW